MYMLFECNTKAKVRGIGLLMLVQLFIGVAVLVISARSAEGQSVGSKSASSRRTPEAIIKDYCRLARLGKSGSLKTLAGKRIISQTVKVDDTGDPDDVNEDPVWDSKYNRDSAADLDLDMVLNIFPIFVRNHRLTLAETTRLEAVSDEMRICARLRNARESEFATFFLTFSSERGWLIYRIDLSFSNLTGC